MSSTSPRAAAAGQQSSFEAELQQQLAGIALPQLNAITGQNGLATNLLNSTQGGTVKSSADKANYASALGQLNQGYGQAAFGNREAINYGALRSGERSGNVMGSALGSAATSLERDRQAALNNLQFQSASSSLTDYNQLLSLMGQGSQTALGLGGQAGQIANGAIGGLNNQSVLSQVLGGVSAGAGIIGSLA